ESLGEGNNLAEEFLGGHVFPAAIVRGHGEQRPSGGFGHAADQEVRCVGIRICGNEGRRVVLFHGNSFGTEASISPTLSALAGRERGAARAANGHGGQGSLNSWVRIRDRDSTRSGQSPSKSEVHQPCI